MAWRAPISTIDRTSIRPADRAALDDVVAGRLIDSDEMIRRLGGWELSRDAPNAAVPSLSDRNRPAGLFWADTAAAEWVAMHRLLTALSVEGADRLAAMIVAAMVRLIVDDAGRPDRIIDMPLAASLALRILHDDNRIIVLGLRGVSIIL